MTAYHGGKARGGDEIAQIISKIVNYLEDDGYKFKGYWEPFCGMCGVYRHMEQYLPENMYLLASDVHPSLILMWKALQKGWIPPKKVTKAMYERLKNQKGSSPEKAYVGFGHSFGGAYFSGFVQDYGMPPSTKKDKNILAVTKKLMNVSFEKMSYDEIDNLRNWIIYCDPPYGGSSTHSKFYTDGDNSRQSTEIFDTDKFWKWCRKMSKNNLVIISEYEAPKDFVSIYTRTIESRRGGHKKREYLFIHNSWIR